MSSVDDRTRATKLPVGLIARYSLVWVFILLLDLGTKAAAWRYLPLMRDSSPLFPYGGVAVFQDFFGVELSFSLTTNTGAAWGLFRDFPEALLLVRGVILVALFVGLFLLKKREMLLPYCLVIGGALGNIWELMWQGYVIDMIHFKFWGYDYPIFNIADCAICIGIFWWLSLSWRGKA